MSPTNTTRTVVERRPFGPTISEPAAALRTALPQLTPRFSTTDDLAAAEPAAVVPDSPPAVASSSFLPGLPSRSFLPDLPAAAESAVAEPADAAVPPPITVLPRPAVPGNR